MPTGVDWLGLSWCVTGACVRFQLLVVVTAVKEVMVLISVGMWGGCFSRDPGFPGGTLPVHTATLDVLVEQVRCPCGNC